MVKVSNLVSPKFSKIPRNFKNFSKTILWGGQAANGCEQKREMPKTGVYSHANEKRQKRGFIRTKFQHFSKKIKHANEKSRRTVIFRKNLKMRTKSFKKP